MIFTTRWSAAGQDRQPALCPFSGNNTQLFLKALLLPLLFAAGNLFSQNPFITTWKTDNPGTSNSTSITIPTTGSGYNYEVDWDNDGTYDESGITGNVTHDFGSAGTKTIRIRGAFPRIFFNGMGDRQKLLDVNQWGDIAWTSMGQSFAGCSNLNISATDVPNLAAVSSMFQMFTGCSALNGPANIGTWNTGSVTSMESVFLGASIFNQPIGNWNTAMVTNMSGMFKDANAFDQPIGNWNTGEVTSMFGMFAGASNFNQPIGNWNTAKVKSMGALFENAFLFNQPIGNWNTAEVIGMGATFLNANAFNQPIGNWNTAKVTGMSSMFRHAISFNQPIGNWNTAMVTNMSGMFRDASAFDQPIGNWNTGEVTSMSGMFAGAINFNQPIGNWNTAKVKSMGALFENAFLFNQPIGNWNTAEVIGMEAMFLNAAAFNQNIGTWTLNPSITMVSMLNNCAMDCVNYSATLSGWNTNPATPDSRTFGAVGRKYETAAAAARTNLTTTKGWTITGDALVSTVFYEDIDGDGFGNAAVSQNACSQPSDYVTNSTDCNDGNPAVNPNATEICDGLDNDCDGSVDEICNPFITIWKTDNPGTSNSTSITIPTTGGGYNYDVDWDDDGTYDELGIMGDVTHDFGTAGTYAIRIRGAFPRIYFNGSGDREKLLDISQWGTIGWTSMEAAFSSCVNLNISATDLPDLSGVTSMASMFFGCSSLDGPANIGTWNTGTVTNMRSMFFGADLFNQLIGTWNTAAVTDMTTMFFGDESFNQDLGDWVLNASVIMSNMLTSTGMDCANYSATLIGWANNPVTPSGRSLGASGRKYETAAVAAWDNLTMTKGWTIIDAGLVSNTFYADTDGDGFGDASAPSSFNTCAPPSGYAANTTDCDDACAACFPGNPEICDGKDNDCNGTIDDVAACGSAGTRTWTGLISTDWHTPCNWDPGCVPTADDDVIIPNATNDPTISAAAVAKSVVNASGSVLTVAATGLLTLNGSTSFQGATTAFGNNGTVHNNGTITIGSTTTPGLYGLHNRFVFNNNTGGQINIDRPNFIGLYNQEGTFNNAATIIIGAIPIAISMDQGLWNEATFNNNTGGQINIDRTSDAGIWNQSGTFANAASILIGANVNIGTDGIVNYSTFNNNLGGQINIDRFALSGIFNVSNFTNAAKITIGANTNGAEKGIFNYSDATFINANCAQIFMHQPLWNVSTFTNNGLFWVNTSTEHLNFGTVTNNGIIEYPQGNPIPNVVNNEIIVAPTTANTCDAISPAFGLGSPVDFTIAGIFTDAAATMSAGTYTTATNTFTPTSVLAEGTYTFYVKIEDGNGGCTRIATWQLTTENCCAAPVAICKTATIVLVGSSASLQGSEVNNGSTYECGLQSMTVSPNSFSCSHIGTPQAVTLTVTDVRGNSDECQTTVTVQDNTAPTITCPIDRTVTADAGQCTAVTTYTVTASDNCTYTITQTNGLPSGAAFPTGPNVVNWQVTDAGGNSTICSFTVTVTDGQLPSIVCPANINKTTDPGQCSAVTTYANPTFSDNCAGAYLTRTSGQASGTQFPTGTTNVAWKATDLAGNSSVCNFIVTVTDGQAPGIICPANLVKNTDVGQCTAVATYSTPTFSDNCTGATAMLFSGQASGTAFPKGANSVVWQATDGAGLTKRCTFTVTVNDAQLPTIACPGNQTKAADAGLCTAVVNYTTPTFTDNCAGGEVSIMTGLVSGQPFPKGITVVKWKATDMAGLTKTCSFKVTVNDTQVPTFTLCPSSQSVNTDAGSCTVAVTYATPTASDNCTPLPTVVKISGLASGSAFPQGNSVVVWKATDGAGLTKTCSFTVTVTDAQLPTITCPNNIAVTGSGPLCNAVVTYANPTATDNCAITSNYLLSGLASGSLFSQGVTTNVWRATDNSGLTQTCAFTVTVGCGTAPETMNDERGTMNEQNAGEASFMLHRLSFTLAPNPATTEVRVMVEGLGENGGEITVLDAQGRVVWQQASVQGPTSSIDVSDLPSGLYQVRLRTERGVVVKGLMVSRF